MSGIVFTRSPLRSYTVTVWRYIMFCANTCPRSEATTDFGEMSPVIVRVRLMAPAEDGIARVVVVVGAAVEEVVVELSALPSAEIAFFELSEPPAPATASAPRTPNERSRARTRGMARRGITQNRGIAGRPMGGTRREAGIGAPVHGARAWSP